MSDYKGSPPRTDDALDSELQAALVVEPSPDFLARVRERVARDSIVAFPSLRWRVVLSGAGLAVIVAVVAIAWRAQGTPTSPTSEAIAPSQRAERIDAAVPPTSTAPDPVIAPSAVTSYGTRSDPQSTTRARVTSVNGFPEVMIANYETAALHILLTDISAGRLNASNLGEPPSATTSEGSFEDLAIPLIVIAPLARLDLLEGDRP